MPLRRLLPCCCAAVCAAVALSGCAAANSVSTSGFAGAQAGPALTISNFASDAQGRDESKICENDLASNLVAALSAGGRKCATVITNQLPEVDDYSLTIEKITVKGTSATAQVKDTNAGKTHLDTLRLVKQGKVWKISGLA